MLGQSYSSISFAIVIRLLLTGIVMIPTTLYANDSDGMPFTPNSFDITLEDIRANDLHVYSQNHEYTDLDLYDDYGFAINVDAFIGSYNLLSSIDVTVKARSSRVESSFRKLARLPVRLRHRSEGNPRYPIRGAITWSARGAINHRTLAGFAIEACQQNADSWVRAGNSIEGHYARDHTLPLELVYHLQLNPWSTYRSSPQDSGTHTQSVRTGRNIICHGNDATARPPPPSQFIIRHIKFEFSSKVLRPGECQLEGTFVFKTNTPRRLIHFNVFHQHNRQDYNYANLGLARNYPSVISTDEKGIAAGKWGFTLMDRAPSSRTLQNSKIGQVRIRGDASDVFESKLLTYEIDCHKPRINVDKIKQLGLNPKLQIPTTQLPGRMPILRPDAPDARLQQNSNMPRLQLQRPAMGIRHTLPTNRPSLKSVTPNSRMTTPKQAPVLKSNQPIDGIQPSVNPDILKPLLDKVKKARPEIKPNLTKD